MGVVSSASAMSPVWSSPSPPSRCASTSSSSPISRSISATSLRTCSGRLVALMAGGSYPAAGGSALCGRPAGGTAKPGDGIRAQSADVVAALLQDHESAAERGEAAAHLVIAGGGQGEVADRVLLERVEAERDDDDRTGRGGDPVERPVQVGEIGRIVRAQRLRQVEVGATTRPLPHLVCVPEEERVEPPWIGVERGVDHVLAAPEDLLGAVAVMDIDVEDGDPLPTGGHDRLRGDRGVVE